MREIFTLEYSIKKIVELELYHEFKDERNKPLCWLRTDDLLTLSYSINKNEQYLCSFLFNQLSNSYDNILYRGL